MTSDLFPQIETARLLLRAFRADDLPFFQSFALRPAFWRYLPGPEPTADLVEAFVLGLASRADTIPASGDFHFCIEDRAASLPIGSGRLSIASREHGQGNVAVSLDGDHWGRGLGREAMAGLVHWGFSDLGLHRISALVDTENAPARKMLVACGFREEGHLHQNLRVRGEWRDSLLFARLAAEAVPGAVMEA